MSNEVYIDGCNVAECEFYPNCYFKQLQRAKAENEHILKIIDCKNGTIATLKAENEKLKKEVEELKEHIEDCYQIYKCKQGAIDTFSNFIKNLSSKNKIYKQALEEIRDMAEYDCEYECSNNLMRKINEVLNET